MHSFISIMCSLESNMPLGTCTCCSLDVFLRLIAVNSPFRRVQVVFICFDIFVYGLGNRCQAATLVVRHLRGPNGRFDLADYTSRPNR